MTSALIEGIEEAHWEQRRIRSTTAAWHIDPVYTNSMAWVDAAWDEIQARREEENSAPFSAEDAVESHYYIYKGETYLAYKLNPSTPQI
jgi:hypothetical protein